MYTEFGGGLLETYALQVVGSERRCIHAIQYVYKTIVSFSQTCHSNKARVAEQCQAIQRMQLRKECPQDGCQQVLRSYRLHTHTQTALLETLLTCAAPL